eukprot:359194-Chlamydomonas_euryale.AAC.18
MRPRCGLNGLAHHGHSAELAHPRAARAPGAVGAAAVQQRRRQHHQRARRQQQQPRRLAASAVSLQVALRQHLQRTVLSRHVVESHPQGHVWHGLPLALSLPPDNRWRPRRRAGCSACRRYACGAAVAVAVPFKRRPSAAPGLDDELLVEQVAPGSLMPDTSTSLRPATCTSFMSVTRTSETTRQG